MTLMTHNTTHDTRFVFRFVEVPIEWGKGNRRLVTNLTERIYDSKGKYRYLFP